MPIIPSRHQPPLPIDRIILRDAPDTGISLVWPITGAHSNADVFVGIVRGRTANSSR